MTTHAVVIGASMAGLLAARVLRDHFDHVTIIERDKLPDGPEFRAGVPQARHAHALLSQGQQIMEALFPQLKDDFVAMGAPSMRWGMETATMTPGGWVKRFDTGITTNVCTRVGLEWAIRRRLSAYDNVIFLQERQITQLLTTADHSQVTGVRVADRHGDQIQELSADLVIDTSGRGSKTPEWLVELGYAAPKQSVVNAHLGYATRWYNMPPNVDVDWKVLLVNARPKQGLKRAGAIFQVEGDRWLAILAGTNYDYPPTDETEFMEFAKTLASSKVYEALQHAEPISPVYGYRRTENVRHHYEHLTRFPERLVVMGDAFCAFNPIYGQGMTVAALDAQTLDTLLKERQGNLTGLPQAAHQRLAQTVENAWLMATGEDLRYPETEGPRPGWMDRVVQRYLDLVMRALPRDEAAALAFMHAMNLTKAPAELLHPRILWRVLLDSLVGKPDDHLNAPTLRVREVPLAQAGD